MKTSRGLVAIAILAGLLAGALGPSAAAACCRSAAAAVQSACGGCCPQASVCAPRSPDESTTARAFSYEAPALASTPATASSDSVLAGRFLTSPRPLAAATPPHLSHIPLLV
jgi:hypothetical protein